MASSCLASLRAGNDEVLVSASSGIVAHVVIREGTGVAPVSTSPTRGSAVKTDENGSRHARGQGLRVLSWVGHFRFGTLARSSISVMVLSGARLGAQLAWVLLLARVLGAPSYGAFSGIASLALAMSGFVGMGLSLRMYQDTARDPVLFPGRWRQALHASLLSGCGLAVLFFAVANVVFSTANWQLLLAVALSELTLAPIVALVANAYAAHGWMGYAAAAPVQLSCARIAAALALYAFPHVASINIYGWLHALATGFASAAILRSCLRRLNIRRSHEALRWSDIKAGLGFSAVQASGLALTTLDKSFALRWGGDVLAGRYVAAYRFVSVAVLPVDSLMIAVMPHLFRAGLKKGQASMPLLAILAVATGMYGIIMGALVWYGADIVPRLLGTSFMGAQQAVRMLALYVPLYCLRTLGTNILLCFGWKTWRFTYEVIALIVMLIIAAWRIPAVGLPGAVSALLAAEIVLGLLVWGHALYSLFGRSFKAAD